jgi:hypothetical protein
MLRGNDLRRIADQALIERQYPADDNTCGTDTPGAQFVTVAVLHAVEHVSREKRGMHGPDDMHQFGTRHLLDLIRGEFRDKRFVEDRGGFDRGVYHDWDIRCDKRFNRSDRR